MAGDPGPQRTRGRWRYDPERDELVEDTPAEPHHKKAEKDAEAERLERERDERDAHPGNYV